MGKMNKLTAIIGAVALLMIAVTAVTFTAKSTGAIGGDDNEVAITGDALDKASAAALAHTGEGRVTGTEVGDEESLYEVEVTLDNGTEVDVQLDAAFNIVGSEAEDENEDEGNDADGE